MLNVDSDALSRIIRSLQNLALQREDLKKEEKELYEEAKNYDLNIAALKELVKFLSVDYRNREKKEEDSAAIELYKDILKNQGWKNL